MPITDNYAGSFNPIAPATVGVPPVPISAATATTMIPPLTATIAAGVPVNPYSITAGATMTGVASAAVFPWTPPPGCSCTYTWMFNGDKAMDPPVRRPSFDCPQHFPPEPNAASDHACPTCGR